MARVRRRHRSRANALANTGTGPVGEAAAQRPFADFSVRRRGHGGDGALERPEARERLYAIVRGFLRVHGARHRPGGAPLSRPVAAADVQGADGLYAARQLLVAHARTWRARRASHAPAGP